MTDAAVRNVILANQVACTKTARVTTVSAGFANDADTPAAFLAVLQPMSAKEMRNLPEGQREKAWYNIWSLSEFKNREIITDPEGVIYHIQSVEFWRETPHYQGTATKATDGVS